MKKNRKSLGTINDWSVVEKRGKKKWYKRLWVIAFATISVIAALLTIEDLGLQLLEEIGVLSIENYKTESTEIEAQIDSRYEAPLHKVNNPEQAVPVIPE